MRDYSRADLLQLTPSRYLADGFLDAPGKPRRELVTDYATAAATQLHAAELSPQEFAYTYEALRQTLAIQEGAPGERIKDAVDDTLATVSRMIQQPNNEGLAKWLRECAAFVTKPADIDALLGHILAVLRQYSLYVASPPPSS